MSKKGLRLIIIVCLGTVFRLTNLGGKTLWLDEIITALFTSGQGYEVIPRETLFPIQTVPSFFTYQPQTCSQLSTFLAEQSTHPPLFFCLLHHWLGGVERLTFLDVSIAFQLRSLSVVLGVIAIGALYYFNRFAFSPKAGITAAMIMAVSPFAVYLAQEARQYTLLLVLIIIALLALVELIRSRNPSFWVWLLWGSANSLGCYTHYFFVLSFIAQIFILSFFLFQQSPKRLFLLGSVIIGVALSYLPWLPIVIHHFSSAKTDWLPDADLFSPIYQSLLGWLVMVVTFPVESQPLYIQIISGVLMLGFGAWLLYEVGIGYRELLQNDQTRTVTLALSFYLGLLFLQFLIIIYVLDKNIAIAPRYNYVYYPAICALLAASLAIRKPTVFRVNLPIMMTVLVGTISSVFVVSNLFFIKPYLPEVTAQRFNQSPEPLLIVMAYKDNMDIALGLSYGLALNQVRDSSLISQFIFLNRNQGYQQIWDQIQELQLDVSQVWLIGTGLKQVAFPDTLGLNRKEASCLRDRANYYRIGIPYQRYQC